jgi:hypothetical protein
MAPDTTLRNIAHKHTTYQQRDLSHCNCCCHSLQQIGSAILSIETTCPQRPEAQKIHGLNVMTTGIAKWLCDLFVIVARYLILLLIAPKIVYSQHWTL